MAPVSGACGIVSLTREAIAPGVVEAMAAVAPYRGPATVWSPANCQAVLAQQARRGGAGPYVSSDLVVVGDVRLDDRSTLAAQLGDDGVGVPPGDLALVAAAFRRWGPRCVERLLGDYAFAVLDVEDHRLFLARDPMGMRPLHLRVERGRRVVFGTEAVQVLAAPGVPDEIDERAVAAHLLLADHDAMCFFAGVESLGPGEGVLIEGPDRIRRSRRVVLEPGPLLRYRSLGDYADHLRHLWLSAVEDRVRDAPGEVGVLLSGGMDSGSVAASAGWLRTEGRVCAEPLRTYSWAYEVHPECDERAVSSLIVEAYGLLGRDIPDAGAWPLGDLPACGPHADDPLLGAFQVMIERSLAAAAADGVSTLLGGDRGDLVAGPLGLSYPRLVRRAGVGAMGRELAAERAVCDRTWPPWLWHEVAVPLGRGLGRVPARARAALARRSSGVAQDSWVSPYLSRLLSDAPQGGSPPGALVGSWERRSLILLGEQMRGMQWSERTYARHGVAFVDPWSDLRVAQFAVDVPQGVLNRAGGPNKRLVREAMAGVMPDAARLAAGKVLPTPFFEAGLRGPAAATVRQLVKGSEVAGRGWVDGARLAGAAESMLRGAPISSTLWQALSLEVWLRARSS
jgi:asparagine synthase (glutamine-hydrolysing)